MSDRLDEVGMKMSQLAARTKDSYKNVQRWITGDTQVPSDLGLTTESQIVPSMVILGISMIVLGVVGCAACVVLAAIAEDIRRIRIMRETDTTLADRFVSGD